MPSERLAATRAPLRNPPAPWARDDCSAAQALPLTAPRRGGPPFALRVTDGAVTPLRVGRPHGAHGEMPLPLSFNITF